MCPRRKRKISISFTEKEKQMFDQIKECQDITGADLMRECLFQKCGYDPAATVLTSDANMFQWIVLGYLDDLILDTGTISESDPVCLDIERSVRKITNGTLDVRKKILEVVHSEIIKDQIVKDDAPATKHMILSLTDEEYLSLLLEKQRTGKSFSQIVKDAVFGAYSATSFQVNSFSLAGICKDIQKEISRRSAPGVSETDILPSIKKVLDAYEVPSSKTVIKKEAQKILKEIQHD